MSASSVSGQYDVWFSDAFYRFYTIAKLQNVPITHVIMILASTYIEQNVQ